MIEQIGQGISFDAFFTADGIGATLLTVKVDVWRGATQIVTDGDATEIGGGIYTYALAGASVTNQNHYRAVFKTASTSVDQRQLPALWAVGSEWVENIDDAISAIPAAPSAAAVADAVWDEAHAGHSTADTTGALLRKLDVGEAETPVVPVPAPGADADTCLVYGYLETPDNVRAAGAVVSFELLSAAYGGALASERVIHGRVISRTADADGYVHAELQRNDLLIPTGSRWLVTCRECGWNQRSVSLTSSRFDLKTLVTG